MQPLLPRLDEAAARLEEAYQILTAEEPSVHRESSSSEDWVRDNFHVVDDQMREIRHDLPRRFYQQLVKLADGPSAGLPRVYVLASELIAHTEGRLDLESLTRFSEAYQSVVPFSIGEVWAIPIMLRIGLVEELSRLADAVVETRRERQAARRWIARVKEREDVNPGWLDRFSSHWVDPKSALSPAFVVELLQWLRDEPPSILPAWQWLQERLDRQSTSADEMLRLEHQQEAARQLMLGNVIGSMRLLSTLNWRAFFEQINLVERVLRGDPARAYGAMDFETADRYRRSVEQLARRSRRSEMDVARQAVECAAARSDDLGSREGHVGYYLISQGRFAFEKQLGYRRSIRERAARFASRHPAIGYLGVIAGLLGLSLASLLIYGRRHGADTFDLVLIGLLVIVPVSDLVISLVNRLITSQVPPRPLPKLAFADGIPATATTIVVVPTILSSPRGVSDLVEQLEVRFLANRDPHLHFALLGDFPDAAAETLPDDSEIILEASRLTRDLNERYGGDRFFFFHRARRWNSVDERWMGWERKRGKLAEFNRLLRGATDTSYVVQIGELSLLPSVRYVITLDSDTRLPIDAARRLVGTIAHPLNRARYDPALGRVTDGYGVLQPRIEVDGVSATRTTFARVHAGQVGLDPYSSASCDIYQDLFHEGTYVGKGIYDVDAFEASLAGRVPENRLLSHDLFEGFYARVGLCTDITLVDDYPSSYLVWAARQHRWIRGDWQIVRWLWRTVPTASGAIVPNILPLVSRWKILDNLRRSLLAPALLLLLAASWLALPGSPFVWTMIAVLVLGFPAYVELGHSLSQRAHGIPLREHLRSERRRLVSSARLALFSTVFLAHHTCWALDAIVRTLVRLLITHRHLLEWESAAASARRLRHVDSVLRRMWTAPALAAVLLVLVAVFAPRRLTWALVPIGLWFAAPAVAYSTGRTRPHGATLPTRTERRILRHVARRTWRYFEEFVGPADNWLIPDNYQEDRPEPIAHRTSPTNIGLQLLATVSANDLGYASLSATIESLERTCSTLAALDRHRGHFYNWYDTRTRVPLLPSYVSTVDSGNLAGYLLTLKESLVDLIEARPILGANVLDGLDDTAAILEQEADRVLRYGRRERSATLRLKPAIVAFRRALRPGPASLSDWRHTLTTLADRVSAFEVVLQEVEEELQDRPGIASRLTELHKLAERLAAAVGQWQRELLSLSPWVDLSDALPRTSDDEHGGRQVVSDPPSMPSVAQIVSWCTASLAELDEYGVDSPTLRDALERSRSAAAGLAERAERVGMLADDLVEEMDFEFLFDTDRELFSIGFSVTDGRLDSSFYDLLASEARLASYVAIALGQIPRDHWFKLGRALTSAGDTRVLLSWSGSVFEYLMPLLVMRSYPETLLDETYAAVVDRQIAYGVERGVPWGISEGAYNLQDLEKNYQYKAFGVPGLGLKRGLGEELVVTPYATLLAAPLSPSDTVANLRRLADEGLENPFGYYESIDYTPDRMGPDGSGQVVKTLMAHHQGMSLIALNNAINDQVMPRRFHGEARIKAADLLLQERIPLLVPLKHPPAERMEVKSRRNLAVPVGRRYRTPHTLSPRAHLLSNGSYTVMVTNAGGGYSERRDIAITRWREDLTRDPCGTFIYLRDRDSLQYWSAAYQPTLIDTEDYEATFTPDRAVFRRRDGDIEVNTEVAVSSEDDAELRRVSVTNRGLTTRHLEVTSYAEVVLAPQASDAAHPAFSNLFVETQAVSERDALICSRRPRGHEARTYLFHVLAGRGRLAGPAEYETSRARFLGRGGDVRSPLAMTGRGPLSATVGNVLDPIVSLRRTLQLPPGGTARMTFTTGFAASEEAARLLIEKYHDRHAVARALALASTHAAIEMRHLNVTDEETRDMQRLFSRVVHGDPRLRSADAALRNRLAVHHLWGHGISGDLPIVLVRISESSHLSLVRELLKTHEYCRLKGYQFDLVILNELGTSYLQDLQDEVQRMVTMGMSRDWLDRPGGVFARRADLMPPEHQVLLAAVARAVLIGSRGSLNESPEVAVAASVGLRRARDRDVAADDGGGGRRARPSHVLQWIWRL